MSCLYSSQGFHNIHHYISIFILFEVYFVHGVRKFSSFIFMVEGTFPVSSIVAVTNIHSKHPWRMVPLSAHPLQHLLFVVVESLSHVRLFVTPWTAGSQASLSISNSWSLFKLMSIESVMPSNHLILCRPLFLLPSIFPRIKVFFNESHPRIRWAKYWSFSYSISPSNVYSGLISFRMNWLDLLEFQGTLKSLLQHHSSKVSILQRSAFFTVQLSHP